MLYPRCLTRFNTIITTTKRNRSVHVHSRSLLLSTKLTLQWAPLPAQMDRSWVGFVGRVREDIGNLRLRYDHNITCHLCPQNDPPGSLAPLQPGSTPVSMTIVPKPLPLGANHRPIHCNTLDFTTIHVHLECMTYSLPQDHHYGGSTPRHCQRIQPTRLVKLGCS